jgi:hypothetical protein
MNFRRHWWAYVYHVPVSPLIILWGLVVDPWYDIKSKPRAALKVLFGLVIFPFIIPRCIRTAVKEIEEAVARGEYDHPPPD